MLGFMLVVTATIEIRNKGQKDVRVDTVVIVIVKMKIKIDITFF